MRTVLAVALCLVLGACATFGGGGPDVIGIWDLVSIGGNPLPTAGKSATHRAEVKDGGVDGLHFTLEGQTEPLYVESEYSLGDIKDGCVEYRSQDYRTGEPLVGRIGKRRTLRAPEAPGGMWTRRVGGARTVKNVWWGGILGGGRGRSRDFRARLRRGRGARGSVPPALIEVVFRNGFGLGGIELGAFGRGRRGRIPGRPLLLAHRRAPWRARSGAVPWRDGSAGAKWARRCGPGSG